MDGAAVMKPIFAFICVLTSFSALAYCHPVDMDIVEQIESSGDFKAFNERSQARGLFQITPICFKHFQQAFPDQNKVFPISKDGQVSYFADVGSLQLDDLFQPYVNFVVADWYMGWLFDRTWTVKDALIAYNFGPGNWRKWQRSGAKEENLPKETRNYLKKYEELGGELQNMP